MDQTDELVLISHEAKEFYDEIRGLVVIFLLFTIFFLIAHIALQYFLTRTEYESKLSRAERLAHQLVLGICTFTLTIGLTSYSLLPFTIITNEILVIFPHSYYVQWLNSELIQDLILLIDIGSKISCLTLPFSYFLLTSQGFLRKSYSSFASRLADSLVMVLFFYILCFGTIWSLSSFVSALNYYFLSDNSALSLSCSNTSTTSDSKTFFAFPQGHHQLQPSPTPVQHHHNYYRNHPITFLQNSINSIGWIKFLQSVCIQVIMMSGLELIQMTASLLGLLLLFICTPMGLLSIGLNLITISLRSLPDLTTKQTLYDRIVQLKMEAMTVSDDIECIQLLCTKKNVIGDNYNIISYKSICFRSYTSVTSDEDLLLKCTNQLNAINAEMLQIKQRITRRRFSPFFRESLQLVMYCSCLVLLFVLLRLLESFVFLNILGLLWNMLFGNYGRQVDNSVTYSMMVNDKQYSSTTVKSPDFSFTLGLKPVSSLGYIGAVFQVCLVLSLLVLSLWGFYSLPCARSLRPRYHATSLDIMLANILLFLILSTALPLQTNLLGLTTLTLPSPLKSEAVASLTHSECSDLACDSLNHQFGCEGNTLCPNTKSIKASDSWWNKLITGSYFDLTYWLSFTRVINPFSSASDSLEKLSVVRRIESEEQSIFRQFISRAFGYSSVSPSYGLGVVVLIYNLCFLITSLWVAGRRLGNATLSISLDVMTTLRCLHQLDKPQTTEIKWRTY
ncbi:unnamed protein product [Heterobilharzia americana]|nr:unnamed protein product [Heterobilharzia americana]